MTHYAKLPISPQQVKSELCLRYFWNFCLHSDFDFFTKRSFLQEVADSFQKIYSGEIKTIGISTPPRTGKSYITSLYCAWWLGKNPTKCIMRNTVTATLYNKFS